MLSLYKHENLVRLLGFCDENNEKILVYEYLSKRSLDLHLNNNDLNWTQRLKICIGIARGLAYLHGSETQLRVLHRDVKSSNVLLDENWNAKISDFGLSKFAPANNFTFLYTSVVGTVGYCDPLYAETGFLTKESDIYSLGVVLFEVLCGRLCINNKDDRPLTGLARQCYELNKVDTIIFERPSITDVMRSLETALEYQANKESRELPDIIDSFHPKALCLPGTMNASKIVQLIYTNSGLDLLALASNGVHKLWKWQPSERNPSGKSTASVVPQLWQPTNGAVMSNDVNESKPAEESAACIALPKHDGYFMSVSGGKVSLFRMATFKVITTFMPPPPAATYLAFSPRDNNIIAIGREDSVIQIHNVRADEIIIELRGHQKQITGLSFSWNSLVSSGADAQLCIWDTIGWDKKKSRSIQSPPGHPSSLVGETKVQLHNDEHHILVVHESQIGIYDDQLECLRLWSPREPLSAPISSATYSCDNFLLFTGFLDGAIGVFDANSLRLQCRIAPSAYLSASISSNNTTYPVVIAAHPSYPIQFALGMSDGDVYVVEKSIHI
ncbi:hypothetical protein L2E82_48193 [Cichorium intybus]|uniref:Uncharacterized protein n=1 Tax=Cichorium intybus TaxID=13427 RepID=A0ACB8YWU9_CICIN|nr:hypothetical protein L2E82_48193 [Cichorium intybus]